MRQYLFADLAIASTPALSLPLPASTGRPAREGVAIRVRAPAPRGRLRTWRHMWRDDAGAPVLGVAMTRNGYLLRFPRRCDFAITRDATRIDARPHRPLPEALFDHLLIDQVLPRCIAQRGELIVHAAAVAFGDTVALFVGESGRGKSTLAGQFLRTGHTVLTDDCVILRPGRRTVRAWATYPSLRLQNDSAAALFPDESMPGNLPLYSTKRRWHLPESLPFKAGAKLAAIYFMNPPARRGAGVTIRPLSPSKACIRLMEQSFQLDVLDRHAVGRLLHQAGRVAATTPVFTLDYPRDFAQIASLDRTIERHVAAITGPSKSR